MFQISRIGATLSERSCRRPHYLQPPGHYSWRDWVKLFASEAEARSWRLPSGKTVDEATSDELGKVMVKLSYLAIAKQDAEQPHAKRQRRA
jgi:hypothetical protein